MIRAVVIDDEIPSASKKAKMLSDSGKVDVKGKFTSPLEALDFLKKTKIDAAFIDIEMPEMGGFELVEKILDLQNWVAVVFVTAYNKYAVEAFRLNALDYLMKPVDKERLKETIQRIIEEKNIVLYSERMQVRCFGKFKVFAGNVEVKLRTSKAEELLAYLVESRGLEVSRNEIIDRLWTDYDGDRAVAHFNTTLYYVRKALIQNGIEAPIQHVRGSYCLNTTTFECDYHKFISLAERLSKVNKETVAEYEETVALYLDDYLSGNDFQWAERNKMLIKDKYIQMILLIAEYYRTAEKHNEIVDLMKQGLRVEPLHREINYQLIDSLLTLENRVAALKYYDMYIRGLKTELNLDEDEKFKQLMK